MSSINKINVNGTSYDVMPKLAENSGLAYGTGLGIKLGSTIKVENGCLGVKIGSGLIAGDDKIDVNIGANNGLGFDANNQLCVRTGTGLEVDDYSNKIYVKLSTSLVVGGLPAMFDSSSFEVANNKLRVKSGSIQFAVGTSLNLNNGVLSLKLSTAAIYSYNKTQMANVELSHYSDPSGNPGLGIVIGTGLKADPLSGLSIVLGTELLLNGLPSLFSSDDFEVGVDNKIHIKK